MPLLDPTDLLPRPVDRVLVAGTSGSGKTTVVKSIGEILDCPTVEVDSLYHGPNWTVRETFEAEVTAFSDQPRWAMEWQYPPVKPMLAAKANLLVFLDHPRSMVTRRIVLRTVRRRLSRERLWESNYESPLHSFFTAPEDNIIRWAWRTHRTHGPTVRALLADSAYRHLSVVRLRGQGEVDAWLRGPLRHAANWRVR